MLMKINNPFDRKEKRDVVPMSLFPIKKICRTSFQIGRATPVCTVDMMQGNKIKLGASELTRFASMSKPVMNNYKVDFRAFFVPYRALDGFFDSYYMNQYFKNHNGRGLEYVLHADQFFDASRPDATRVHPIKVKKRILTGTKLIGGLADHLGYRTYDENLLDYEVDSQNENPTLRQYITAEWNKRDQSIIANVADRSFDGWVPNFILTVSLSNNMMTHPDDSIGTLMACPTSVYALNMLRGKSVDMWDNSDSIDGWLTRNPKDVGLFYDDFGSAVHYVPLTDNEAAFLYGLGIKAESVAEGIISLKDITYTGSLTLDAVLGSEYNYLISLGMTWTDSNFEANVIRYLSYMRIYSDHFLPENFCKADDFRDIIGEAYMNCIFDNGQYTTLGTLFDTANNSMYGAHTLKSYGFFAPYLQNGECLPVLWPKDYFTSLRPDLSINGENRTDFKYQGNGVADTPVGRTIREHYFNRKFQLFKDLIARLGYDARKNTAAIYGFSEDDKSLRSSISLSTHSFDVQIGDIAQTSESSINGNLGQFGGFAVSRDSTGAWEWTAGCNGVFMIIAYIRPNGVAYSNAVDRSILKDDYYDYLLPQFGGVGYQDVSEKEIGGSSDRKIGNHEIYFEYMMMNNEVSGLMRTSMKDYGSDRYIKTMRLADESDISPLFITEKDEPNRVFNDTNEDTDPIVGCIYFNGSITRQLPEHIELDF